MRLKIQFKNRLAAAVLSTTVCLVGVGFAAAQSDNDVSAKQPHRRLGRVLWDIFFQTPDRGWAVGQDGFVFFTTDGGSTWQQRTVGDETLRQIAFQDSNRGWLLTETTLFRTTDAGSTWTPAKPPSPGALSRIYFINAEVGWLLYKDGSIFKTADGGDTWRRQISGTKEQLNHIACFSPSSCLVVGKRQTLLATSNGGRTWIKRSLPVSAYYEVRRIDVTRDATVFALAAQYKSGRVLRSSDRGRRWEVLTGATTFENPLSLHFFDRDHGIVVDGAIRMTADGCATWEWVWPGSGSVGSIFFIDEKLGWAAGDFQTILHTTDGGKTWVKQRDDGVIPVPHE
jgi:photosystem II stability/assembly factor-like uncharacterized protein